MTRRYCRVSIASIGPIPDGIDDRDEEGDEECNDDPGVETGGPGPVAEDGRGEAGGEREGDDLDPENAERRTAFPEY